MQLTYLSFNDFLADASIKFEKWHKQDPTMKYGQVYFHLLSSSRPDIAESLRGTMLDPFHKDEVKGETHKFVESKW
jgi:hypothetical protein